MSVAAAPRGILQQRVVRDLRAAADIADFDRAGLPAFLRCKAQHVAGERQVTAGTAGNTRLR